MTGRPPPRQRGGLSRGGRERPRCRGGLRSATMRTILPVPIVLAERHAACFLGGKAPSCLFTKNRLLASDRPPSSLYDHPGHLHRPTAPARCEGRPCRCAGTGRCRRGACGGASRSCAFACYSHANVPHIPSDRMTLILNDIFSNILIDLPTMMPDVGISVGDSLMHSKPSEHAQFSTSACFVFVKLAQE